jgi:hypothetical protein
VRPLSSHKEQGGLESSEVVCSVWEVLKVKTGPDLPFFLVTGTTATVFSSGVANVGF